MSIMTRRFILWFSGIGMSFAAGLFLDREFPLFHFPLHIRILAAFVIFFAVFLLARSGRLLRKMGKPTKDWGWTTKLVTTDLYKCLRHPHHLGIGLFAAGFSALVGNLWTFFIVTSFIWTGILLFLKRVEEPELVEKFGREYTLYKEKTPMLFPHSGCLLRVLFRNLYR